MTLGLWASLPEGLLDNEGVQDDNALEQMVRHVEGELGAVHQARLDHLIYYYINVENINSTENKS